MWSSETDEVREYHYYNDEGVFIGKSEGASPQQDLFEQAHYVFDSEQEIIKNCDLLSIAKRKLQHMKKELIGIPIKNITKIMELNENIAELEKNIEQLRQNELKIAG